MELVAVYNIINWIPILSNKMNNLDVTSVVDLKAMTDGLAMASRKYGLFIPFVAIDYLENMALTSVSLSGTSQMLAQAAVKSFFYVWKVDMIGASK